MKLNLLIICLVLISCSNNISSVEIIPKNKFVQILQDIHIMEANYDINKSKGEKRAKENLNSDYQKIFLNHNITKQLFNNTMSYYSRKPNQLEEIYDLTLQKISAEKDSQYD